MWSEVIIGGKRVDVFDPPDADPRRAILYLHGYACERLPDIVEAQSPLRSCGLRIVAPQGGRCWWLDQVCQEFDPHQTPLSYVRETVLPWIQEKWQVIPPYIGLLGVSMGGQGVLNLAYRSARQFPCVAAISPAIDFQRLHGQGWMLDQLFTSAEAARQQSATLHLHPLNWPEYQYFCCDPLDRTWYEGCERLASKLNSSGIPFQADLVTSQGGHNWGYFSRMLVPALTFLKQSLEQIENCKFDNSRSPRLEK